MEKKRILLIDDEEDYTKTMKLNLERTDKYEVITENRGAKALLAVRKTKPDLILLDIIMPDMDGNEIAYRIESDKTIKHIPLVFLTVTVSGEEVNYKGSVIGGHYFIPKAASMEEIIDCIEENIYRSKP